MSDHHQRSGDTPLYGEGPGVSWPESFSPPTRTQAMSQYTRPQTGPLAVCPTCGNGVDPARLRPTAADAAAVQEQPRPEDDEEYGPAPGVPEHLDLTAYDHLAVNTVKDDPYGMDAALPAPAQTWGGQQ